MFGIFHGDIETISKYAAEYMLTREVFGELSSAKIYQSYGSHKSLSMANEYFNFDA